MAETDYQELDLLGDPVPPNFGGRGRPQHVPTPMSWLKVNAMWAFGFSNDECASALGISGPTFRKWYFRKSLHKAARAEAMLRLKAERFGKLIELMRADNVPAIKELGRLIEREELRLKPPAPKEEKLGKKEAAVLAAPSAHEGTSWESILNPNRQLN